MVTYQTKENKEVETSMIQEIQRLDLEISAMENSPEASQHKAAEISIRTRNLERWSWKIKSSEPS